MDDLYLDNIDEFVNDHNKIVTYKWLSFTLGVHVNVAKQMLYHYLDHKRKEGSAQLNATYLVSGKCVKNGHTSHKVSVVREEKLEDVKSKMSLIVSVHVYSVQKSVLKDSAPLYSVDYDFVKDNHIGCSRYSAIRCAGAVAMSSAEMQLARETARVPAPEPPSVKVSMNGHGSLKSKPSSKTPKGILGMFANKPAPKNLEPVKELKSEPKEEAEVPKSKPVVKNNPMSNFFGTQVAKRPENTVKREDETPSSSTAEQRAETTPTQKAEEAVEEEQPKEAKNDIRSKTKRKEDSDSEEEKMEKKKRRRIKKPQSDSSDDEVIPDSPVQQGMRALSPSADVQMEEEALPRPNDQNKRRKRRRVLKSRTFMDEEGCIVTEKCYESESYSETEEDVQSSKAAPATSMATKRPANKREEEKKSQKKSTASAGKGSKQASIMGFFQKK